MIARYIKPKGLIHIGAHGGGEYNYYVSLQIKRLLFFEPQKYWFNQLLKHQQEVISNFPDRTLETDRCINTALGNFNGDSKMYISSNSGASSSILQPNIPLFQQYPELLFKENEIIKVIRLDDFWKTYDLKPDLFDTLVLDTQGYELEVLRGAIDTLKFINTIQVEVQREELYVGSVQIHQLDAFLTEHGFQRRLVSWCGGTWGDAVYTRPKPGKIKKETIESLCNLKIDPNHWCFKLRDIKIHLTLNDNSCFLQVEDSEAKIVCEDLLLEDNDLIIMFKYYVMRCGG